MIYAHFMSHFNERDERESEIVGLIGFFFIYILIIKSEIENIYAHLFDFTVVTTVVRKLMMNIFHPNLCHFDHSTIYFAYLLKIMFGANF